MLSLGEDEVVTAPFLRKKGYSYGSLKGYVRHGYLDSLGRGAYCRAGTRPSVEAAVFAMAGQLALPVHVGGRSALAKRGHVHFVPFSGTPATLFLPARGARLPAWFRKHYAGRFALAATGFLPETPGVEPLGGCPVSSDERAFLEFLHGVPAKQSLAEAWQLLETLPVLRPKLLGALLSACSSVKVKRLFFLLADDLDAPWWRRVDKRGIDLGSGCRAVGKGGTFHARYNLVVKPWRES